jgi:DNA invertase Pin-like site-specific DNA recombinase
MKIGYVRISKQEQHEALQIDALKEAGCEKWFLDKITGSKAERKGLDEGYGKDSLCDTMSLVLSGV